MAASFYHVIQIQPLASSTHVLLFLIGFCAIVWKCIRFLGECCKELSAEYAQRTRLPTYAAAAGVPPVIAVQLSTPRDQSLETESSADLSPSYGHAPFYHCLAV